MCFFQLSKLVSAHFLDNNPPSCQGRVPGVRHAAGFSSVCQLRSQKPPCPPDMWHGAQTSKLGHGWKARTSLHTLWLNSDVLCLSMLLLDSPSTVVV